MSGSERRESGGNESTNFCPVCNRDVAAGSPDDLSRHVELCLKEKDSPTSDDDVMILDDEKASSINDAPCCSNGSQTLEPLTQNEETCQSDIKGSIDKDILEKMRRVPLAEQMRPSTLEGFVGHPDAVGTKGPLAAQLASGQVQSVILWGPPGCGKTTLAHIISTRCKSTGRYTMLSMCAATSGVQDVKTAITKAANERKLTGRITVLFMDEIHRFNKAQQDVFLPHIESGLITLLGATTENPSFSLNSALLSRCTVVSLCKLETEQVAVLVERAVSKCGGGVIEKEEGLDTPAESFVFKRAT